MSIKHLDVFHALQFTSTKPIRLEKLKQLLSYVVSLAGIVAGLGWVLSMGVGQDEVGTHSIFALVNLIGNLVALLLGGAIGFYLSYPVGYYLFFASWRVRASIVLIVIGLSVAFFSDGSFKDWPRSLLFIFMATFVLGGVAFEMFDRH
jgi:hypothetical protein